MRPGARMFSKFTFKLLSPFGKGVAVYMGGERDDEPNVPPVYSYRTERRQREYQRGQAAAVQECQDNP